MSLDWATLHGDLVDLIAGRVLLTGDLLDYVRFRAVCSHWSTSTVRPQGRGILDPRLHPRRWMMLPEGNGLYPGHPDLRGFVRFFNLSTGAFVRVHLPPLDDHTVLDSVDGLLLLQRRDYDTAVRLLHPFTGEIAELPPLTSILPQIEPGSCSFVKVCSTSVTVSSTGAITVMLALGILHSVAYATAGDQRWTLSAWKMKPMFKPVSFQGKLYVFQFASVDMCNKLHIYQFNPPCPDVDGGPSHLPLPVKIVDCPSDRFLYILNFVECGSELLLVAYNDASRSKLLVYRIADMVRGKIEPITSIGDNTLYLNERSLCVSTSPSMGMSPNSIICLHSFDFLSRDRFEKYDLGTGIWTPASDGDISQRPPPNPHTLTHHIFTCCNRLYWTKGIIF